MKTGDSLFQAWFGRSRPSFAAHLRQLASDLDNVDECAAGLTPEVAINSWALTKRAVPCLIGLTVGHPGIKDGRPACSSELFYLDPERGIARTMSRWYRLGTRVDPEFWTARLTR